MAKESNTSARQSDRRGAGRRGGKARQDDAAAPARATEGEPDTAAAAVEGAADPWAESDAAHPDECSSNSPDQHPQPGDEATRDRGA
jgi:hypothetical protein